MQKTKKSFNIFFEPKDLTTTELYSKTIVKSLIRSILEPVAASGTTGLIFTHIKDIKGIEGLLKRIEYSKNAIMRNITDFEFSKFDIEANLGFIVLTTNRYNCAFLFREVEQEKYEIYLKINSKLVNNVYETIKSIFLIDFDEVFYSYRPERRDNDLMNDAILNIIKHFEETLIEHEYTIQIQQNYKTVNEKNTTLRNEIYAGVKQIAHEIKNQLSILDIYARIFEKKTGDLATAEPIRKSISLIKNQIEQFKNLDVINLQERNVKALIEESIKMYSQILKEKNNKLILIDEMAGVSANSFVDEEKFLIVINNIIKNAHDSTCDDEIIIRISQAINKIKISIINHGSPIEEDNQKKIFEQGFSTKQDGWGVGLSVCKKYIGSQFGTFELEKSDAKETIFTLLIPLIETKGD